MILYHTSDVKVLTPDVMHSRRAVDFGQGFYLTSLRRQAEDFAERFTRDGREAWLNVYELKYDLKEWKIKVFPEYDEEWLDFVFNCRKGLPVEHYDLIVGGVADDRVFETVNLFLMDMIDKDKALKRLIFHKPNIQYCIRSQELINRCLTFKESVNL